MTEAFVKFGKRIIGYPDPEPPRVVGVEDWVRSNIPDPKRYVSILPVVIVL